MDPIAGLLVVIKREEEIALDNFKKDLQQVLSELLELPIAFQTIVAEDIVETAKTRVATMKKLCHSGRN